MEWLKSQLASWKVRIALVGGVVVVATAFGTCSFDPSAVSNNTTTETTPTTETVEVSSVTETTGTTETTNSTDTPSE